MIMNCLGKNEAGNLTIGGMDVAQLAQQYGTPLYLMDEMEIRRNCRTYKQALEKHYDGNGMVLYAGKAFLCKYMCRILQEEGLGLDVVSGGELYTALCAGMSPETMWFHGNNKTAAELAMAVENNVGTIVVDNKYELATLNDIARQAGKTVGVAFRIKPGIDAHTHDFIMTGQIDSKFGFALETGEAEDIVAEADGLSNISINGLHCHIGSQIFDIEPFVQAAKTMMHFIGDLRDKYGIVIPALNLGGGYGIKYTEEDDPVPYGDYIEKISVEVKQVAAERNVALPKILMEPGRSMVAPAGITVYSVGAVKHIPNVRTYVSVDGGMTDNPRYTMYEATYDAVLVDNPAGKNTQTVTLAGKCCETDTLIKNLQLPPVQPGQYLAVLATGGYNYAMSSNYNRTPRPPVVMVKDGEAKIVVKRESYDDLLRNDVDVEG